MACSTAAPAACSTATTPASRTVAGNTNGTGSPWLPVPLCAKVVRATARRGGRDDHDRAAVRRAGGVTARLHLRDGIVDLDLAAHPRHLRHHPAEAETTKLLAFNQGFYNLFLAIVTGIGIAVIALGHTTVGAALVFAGIGSMAAAAVVLLVSAPDKARAALAQGTFPAMAIVLLLLGLQQ